VKPLTVGSLFAGIPSEVLTLGFSAPDLKSSGRWRLIRFADRCSRSTGRTSRGISMFAESSDWSQ
jgi:hypothetical protein